MMYLIAAIAIAGLLDGPAQQSLPDIAVPTSYRSSVAAMLRYSPTFRRQCRRIASTPDLHIEILSSLLGGAASAAALTRIVRSDRGIEATVQLGPSGDPVLLIAHEFEHILEQLDGVDLPVMATRVATGCTSCPVPDTLKPNGRSPPDDRWSTKCVGGAPETGRDAPSRLFAGGHAPLQLFARARRR